jgi:hypothetical protein
MRLPGTVSVVAVFVLLTACSSATNGTGRALTPAPSTTAPKSSSSPAPVESSTSPAPATSSDAGQPPAKPLRTVTVTGTDGATSSAVSIWAEKTDPTCTDHAYGTPVINYLKAHTCTGLHRILATTTLGDQAVGLAVSDLGFKGNAPQVYQTAGRFEELVKKDGTGNIKDLLREGYRLPAGPAAVPFPDAFSALGQDAGVEILDAWYLTGSTPDNDPKLVALEQSLFLQLG